MAKRKKKFLQFIFTGYEACFMNLVPKQGHLAEFVIVGSIIGYPFVSVISKLLQIESELIAIIFRTTVLAFSLLLFLGRTGVKRKLTVSLFMFFWGAYFLRLAYTMGSPYEYVPDLVSTYWIWSIGVCMVPSLAILLCREQISFNRISLITAVLGAITMAVILLIGGTMVETDYGASYDQNRWSLSTINPITIGHLGTSLFIVASFLLFNDRGTALRSMFYLGVAGLGVVGLILANSRGPLVAFAIALGMLGIFRVGKKRAWIFGISIAAFGLGVIYENITIISGESGIIERFAGAVSGEENSYSLRQEIISDAMVQFMNSPLVGDGVEVRGHSIYPHNVMIEAFMTTGLIGGVAFLILTILSLRASSRIMKHEPDKAVLALLAVQFIVAGQFSGAIYQSGAMWVLMAGVLSFAKHSEKSKHKPKKGSFNPKLH
jgi:hypothetical protein